MAAFPEYIWTVTLWMKTKKCTYNRRYCLFKIADKITIKVSQVGYLYYYSYRLNKNFNLSSLMTPNILWLRALFDSPALVTIIHCQCAIAHRNYIMATVSCWGINYIGYKKQLAIVFCSVYLWVVVIARPIEMPPKQNKTPLEYAERIRHNAQINSIRFASLRSGPLRASFAVTNIHTHTQKYPQKCSLPAHDRMCGVCGWYGRVGLYICAVSIFAHGWPQKISPNIRNR